MKQFLPSLGCHFRPPPGRGNVPTAFFRIVSFEANFSDIPFAFAMGVVCVYVFRQALGGGGVGISID